jgi:Type IV secretory pathway, VirB3-like protein
MKAWKLTPCCHAINVLVVHSKQFRQIADFHCAVTCLKFFNEISSHRRIPLGVICRLLDVVSQEVVGVLAGLALLPASQCEVAMHAAKRGEPLPINQALNRPRAKLGLDLSTWRAIVFVAVTVFLVGFRMIAIFSFPIVAGGAWLIVRKHLKMFQLWGLSLN